MSDLIWVYGEVVEGKITPTTLEMLTKAAEAGKAEACSWSRAGRYGPDAGSIRRE